MPDLEDQIRIYYEATTEPIDFDALTVEPGTVLVGPFPDAARRSAMKTVNDMYDPTTPPERPWWRGPAAASVAFVAVLVVGVVLVTAGLGGDEPGPAATTLPPMTTVPPTTDVATTDAPVTTVPADTPSAIEVAETFIRARNAWDAETTMALFAAGADVQDLEVSEVAHYTRQYEWYQAVGWRWELDECVETDPGPPSHVECSYTHHNAWMDALGDEPIAQSYLFVIEDGRIAELSNTFGTFSAWSEFRNWVNANHPDDVSVMYTSRGGFDAPSYTTEALDLWRRYTEEFAASLVR